MEERISQRMQEHWADVVDESEQQHVVEAVPVVAAATHHSSIGYKDDLVRVADAKS